MQKTDTSIIKTQDELPLPQDRPKFKTIKELFESMPLGLTPKIAEGMDTVIQFYLTGKEPIDGFFTIKDSTCIYEEGSHPNPTTTIHVDSELWLGISNQEVSGEKAFINQQYTAEGDMSILLIFDKLFSLEEDEEQIKLPAYTLKI